MLYSYFFGTTEKPFVATFVEPESIQEVGQVMRQDAHYQAWSSLLRTRQEMMWSSTQIPVQRAMQDLAKQAA